MVIFASLVLSQKVGELMSVFISWTMTDRGRLWLSTKEAGEKKKQCPKMTLPE